MNWTTQDIPDQRRHRLIVTGARWPATVPEFNGEHS